MGFGEDIARLGAAFKESADGLAMQRALAGANEAVNQVKMAEGDEIQKQSQLRQISEALTRDLAQFGAPADRIAVIANSISKPKQMYQTAQQAMINEDPNSPQYKQGLAADEREHGQALQLQGLKNSVARGSGADNRQIRAQLASYQKQYFGVSKELNKATQQARNAVKLIDSGSPLTAGAIGTMLARASGEVGNLTEMERSVFQGRQDLISVAKRYATKKSLSDIPTEDKEALRELAELYSNSGATLLQDYADTLAYQASALPGMDLTPDQAVATISGQKFKKVKPLQDEMANAAVNMPASTPAAPAVPQIPGLSRRRQ